MSWTDERVERLSKLWADGLSASQIAAELGNVTRNAVIGKVHRLGLSGRVKQSSSNVRATKRVKEAPRTSTINTRRTTARFSNGNTALKMDPELDVIAYQDTRPIEDVVVPISKRLTLL